MMRKSDHGVALRYRTTREASANEAVFVEDMTRKDWRVVLEAGIELARVSIRSISGRLSRHRFGSDHHREECKGKRSRRG